MMMMMHVRRLSYGPVKYPVRKKCVVGFVLCLGPLRSASGASRAVRVAVVGERGGRQRGHTEREGCRCVCLWSADGGGVQCGAARAAAGGVPARHNGPLDRADAAQGQAVPRVSRAARAVAVVVAVLTAAAASCRAAGCLRSSSQST